MRNKHTSPVSPETIGYNSEYILRLPASNKFYLSRCRAQYYEPTFSFLNSNLIIRGMDTVKSYISYIYFNIPSTLSPIVDLFLYKDSYTLKIRCSAPLYNNKGDY